MEKYRWKGNKDLVKVKQIHYLTNEMDGSHKEVNYWEVATGGDFRKGYITFTNNEFEKLFEKY